MKLYVLTYYVPWEKETITGIYESKEEAEAKMKKLNRELEDNNELYDEYLVNEYTLIKK